LLLLAFSCALVAPGGHGIRIELWEEGAFVVKDWPAPATPPPGGWLSVLQVYVGEGDVPPLLGDYTVEHGTLKFRPRYPLSPGVRVRGSFKLRGKQVASAEFLIPKVDVTPSTQVLQVYPTSSLIPENQLKFYLVFSAPMSRGEAWRHMKLLDESGHPVDLPFLELDQETWDAEGRRLTVLFDPGRIKRGVLPL
jgi:hypothetical protein